MANQEHLDILKQGVKTWNQWRKKHIDIRPDLSRADLSKATLSDANLEYADLIDAHLKEAHLYVANLNFANLRGADLRGADLGGAYLSFALLNRAHLTGANLRGAHLTGANLSEADLTGANLRGAFPNGANFSAARLRGADLREATLRGVILSKADLSKADLSKAIIEGAVLVETNLTEATLTQCSIYGTSAWDVKLEGAKQNDLRITPWGEPTITVDNLKIAQFIYLLLNNEEIRDVINTITTKVVLILGRFTPDRKAILDALREKLRRLNYLPIVYDFEKPGSRNFTETVRTLAHLARFIIADLTDPSSIPQELQAIIPTLAIPVQPVLLEGKKEYAMFVDFLKTYHWVLPVHYYLDQANLLATLKENVIEPAEQKAQELEKR